MCIEMATAKGIIFVLFCCLPFIRGYHILAIFPQGFRSHFLFNTAILNALTKAGHDVDFVTPFNASFDDNFRLDNSQEINFKPNVTQASQLKTAGIRRRSGSLELSQLDTLHQWTASEALHCYDMMEVEEIKQALDGRLHFKAIITEMLTTHACYQLLARKLDIPIIGTVPMNPWVSERHAGNPINPSYIPNSWTHAGNSMSFYSRMKNTLLTSIIYLWEITVVAVREELFRRHHFPEIEWCDVKPVDLMFLNSHPTLHPRPLVPNVIEIGGVHIPPEAPLPEELQKFIDQASYGVILMTFGTNNVSDIGYQAALFAQAFARIPQRVIWKLEIPYENVTENVLITKWVPQHDVLRQKNVKAFISHCGTFGIQEAVQTATPVVGLPLHIDQIHNALVMEELGVGVNLDMATLTEEKFLQALNGVIHDKKYRENMQKLSNEFNDNPMTAAEKIVYWTEYVIKHKGTPHLKTMGFNLRFYQYNNLDVVVCLLIVFTLIVFSIMYTVKIFRIFIARYSPRSAKKVQ